MLANGAFGLAISVFVLKVLDMFLSDAQKAWLDRTVVAIWVALDEWKRVSLLKWLQLAVRRWLFIIPLLLCVAFIAWMRFKADPNPRDPKELYGTVIVLFIIASGLGLLVVRSVINSTTLPRALLRVTIYAALCLAPMYALLSWAVANQDILTKRPVTVLQMLYILTFFAVFIFTIFIMLFWGTIALPIILIYALTIALFISEFVVRRIAEYPKGPILALSALVSAFFGLLKTFSYG